MVKATLRASRPADRTLPGTQQIATDSHVCSSTVLRWISCRRRLRVTLHSRSSGCCKFRISGRPRSMVNVPPRASRPVPQVALSAAEQIATALMSVVTFSRWIRCRRTLRVSCILDRRDVAKFVSWSHLAHGKVPPPTSRPAGCTSAPLSRSQRLSCLWSPSRDG